MSLRVVPLVPHEQRSVLDVFESALLVEPGYQPQVSSGEVELADWFAAKRPDWSRVAYDGTALVGHVSARRHTLLPGGAPVPEDLAWELGRLVVSPATRRRGVAAALVTAAETLFGEKLWATCVAGGASHRLFTRLGWTEFAAVSYHDDPAPGVALRAPRD